MKDYLFKSILAIACLMLLSITLSGQNAKGGGGGGGSTGGSGCAVVYTPRLSTTTASPGTNIGVFGKVTNCASGKKRYTVTASSTSSCGEETIIASALISFNGGETKGISVAYPIAPDTCLGTMTVTVSVYDGGTLLAIGSTTLTIQ